MKRILILLFCVTAAPFAGAMAFETYENFPTPAPGSYLVVGTTMPDGRLLVWDGNTVYRQFLPNADRFSPMATGYVGDPGFITMAPDGRTAILGAGFSSAIYRLDTAAPEDYTPASVVLTQAHYSGAMLNDDLLLIDASTGDYSATQLEIVDLSGSKAAATKVVRKGAGYDPGKDVIVDKPLGSYSSLLHVDTANGLVYSMDSNTRELRTFSLAALINAFQSQTTLDWSTDGTLVGAAGDFYSGGVSGITPTGDLVIGGSEGFLQPGGIQIVDPRLDDPSLATVLTTLDPANNAGFYSVIYNPITDTITAFESGLAFAPSGSFVPLPVSGGLALIGLAGLLTYAARRRM